MSLGLTDSARAMPMRWRWPPENSCGYFFRAAGGRPTAASSSRSRLGSGLLVLGEPVGLHALEQQRLDRLARVQAAHRVLEDHLDVLALVAQGLALERGDVLAVEHHRALGRRLQVEDGPAQRGLAAPGLADQAVGLAAADLQVDAVDGVDVADDLVEDDALLDGEVDLDPLDVDEDVAGGRPVSGGRRRVADGHRVTSTGLWQRSQRPPPSSSSSGRVSRHTSMRVGAARRERARVVPRAGCRTPSRGWASASRRGGRRAAGSRRAGRAV